MIKFSGYRRLALALGFILAMAAQPASAGSLTIDVLYGGVFHEVIADGSPLDTSPLLVNVITVDVEALNAIILGNGFGDLTFNGLSANSNNPGLASGAQIKINSDATVAAGGSESFTLTTFQTGFLVPTGLGRLSSSAGGSWTQTDGNDTATFQSRYNAGPSSTNQMFTSPNADTGAYAGSSPVVTGFLAVAPFTLTNVAVVTLNASASSLDESNQLTGTTVLRATAIPEPTSVGMMLIALPAIIGLMRRRGR